MTRHSPGNSRGASAPPALALRARRSRRRLGAVLAIAGLALGVATLAGLPTGVGGAAADTGSAPGAPTTVNVTLPVDPTLDAIQADTATVNWTSPAQDGGSAITGYTITPYDTTAGHAGTPVTAGPSTTSVVVTGLTTNDVYTFSVTATNANGTSPAAAAPQSVIATTYLTAAVSPTQDLTDGQTMTVTLTRTPVATADGVNVENIATGWCPTGTEQQAQVGVYNIIETQVLPENLAVKCASQGPTNNENGAAVPLNGDLLWPGGIATPCPSGITSGTCDAVDYPTVTGSTVAQVGEVDTAQGNLVECDSSTPCDFVISADFGDATNIPGVNSANPSGEQILFPVTFQPPLTTACSGNAPNALVSDSPTRMSNAWVNWTLGACRSGAVGGGQAPSLNTAGDEAQGIQAFASGEADLAYSAVGFGAAGFTPTVDRPYVAVPLALNAVEFAAGPQDSFATVQGVGVSQFPTGQTLTIQEATQLISGDTQGAGNGNADHVPTGIVAELDAQDPDLTGILFNAEPGVDNPNNDVSYAPSVDAQADASTLFASTFFNTLDRADWVGPIPGESGPIGVISKFSTANPVPTVNTETGFQNLQKALAPNNTVVNPEGLFAMTDVATASSLWGGLTPFALQAPDTLGASNTPVYVLPTRSALDADVAEMTPQPDGTLVPDPNTTRNAAGVEPYPLTFVEYALVPSQPYLNADCTVDTGKEQLLTQWLDYITGSAGQSELPTGFQSIASVPLPSGADTYGQSNVTTLDQQAAAAIATVGQAPVTGSCATPGAPTGVTATAGTGSVNLTWTAPTTTASGAAGDGTSDGNATPISDYKIVATPATGSPTTIDTSSTSTSYTATGLTPGTAYTFQVEAENQGVTGPLSVASTSVTPTGSSTSTGSLSTTTAAPPPKALPAGDYGTSKSGTTVAGKVTTITLVSGGATAKVTVPAGALPAGTIVSVYPVKKASDLAGKVPSGFTALAGFAVTWITPDGSSPTATSPITVIITGGSIKKGDTVYEVTASAPTELAAAKTSGTVTVRFSGDPLLVLAKPKAATSTTPKPTTTTPTGKSGVPSSGTVPPSSAKGPAPGGGGAGGSSGAASTPPAGASVPPPSSTHPAVTTRQDQTAQLVAAKIPPFAGRAGTSLTRPLLSVAALILLLGGVAFATSGQASAAAAVVRRLRHPRGKHAEAAS